MKRFFSSALIVLSSLVFRIEAALGQVTCVSEVSYRWSSDSSGVVAAPSPTAQSDSKEGQSNLAPSGNAIFWARLTASGGDEVKVRAALAEKVTREKVRASDSCKRLHENTAACISTKHSALSATIQAQGFDARKKLENAIQADCEMQRGKCLEILSSEPACVVSKKEEVAEVTDAAKGKDKKDKKKK